MKTTLAVVVAFFILNCSPALEARVIFYSGDFRTDAPVLDCGFQCTLGPSNADADYAQYGAVVEQFTVNQATMMQAITYGSACGVSLTGTHVNPGALAPYLSLFDSSGNCLASKFWVRPVRHEHGGPGAVE